MKRLRDTGLTEPGSRVVVWTADTADSLPQEALASPCRTPDQAAYDIFQITLYDLIRMGDSAFFAVDGGSCGFKNPGRVRVNHDESYRRCG
jgi:hypothetical protein